MKIFLDYQILDHLRLAENGEYTGKYADILVRIKKACRDNIVNCYMSEISKVEMHLGLRNPQLTQAKREECKKKDSRKIEISEVMMVKWIPYPCSKTDDPYSLLNLSMRCAGKFWDKANTLELCLENINGVSKGDARQLVSMIYGLKEVNTNFRVDAFVSRDEDLVKGINVAIQKNQLPEFTGILFLLPYEFAAIIERNNRT